MGTTERQQPLSLDTVADDSAPSRESLAQWLRIFHPRYQSMLVGLLALGALGAGLLYLENSLLKGLIESVTGEPGGGLLGRIAASVGGTTGAVYVFLAGVFAVGMLNAVSNVGRTFLSSRLSMNSREDLEREVLFHLMRRDDAFFANHSTGEILNRLEVDLYRVVQRRDLMTEVWWAVLTVLANLIFFGLNDWRLALVVLVMCVVGTFLTHRAGRPVTTADGEYFRSHDRVKMDFEDYLTAVPEIQVGGLFGTILQRIGRPQRSRFRTFMTWVRAYAHVGFYREAWPAASFLLAVLIVLALYGREGGSEGLALIPVLIYAMPGIFANVSYLVRLRLDLELSENSVQRILEYEGRWRDLPESSPRPVEDPTVTLQDVTFTYPAGPGETAGGITGVSVSLAPDTWHALVGGAGSGKSTLINVLLGRVRPQSGAVILAGRDLAEAPAGHVPSVATLMPQRVTLLDDTIGANCTLGRGLDAEGVLDAADLEVVEATGLGQVCRLKALEMRPVASPTALSAADLATLREQARALAAGLSVPLHPFEDARPDPERPLFEALVGGRTDVERAAARLLADESREPLRTVAGGPFGEPLMARAREVIAAQSGLLRIESYDEYAAVAPRPLDRATWQLRRALAATLSERAPAKKERLALVRIALTACPVEWNAERTAFAEEIGVLTHSHAADIAALRALLGSDRAELRPDAVHPFLTWRDNLLFAGADLANSRRRRLLDQALVELMAEPRWRSAFLEQGLAFSVGRNGARLSGGQRQLVALNRALLRRTSILVLDEPTSALDPDSRERVTEVLRRWRKGRVLVTISHDPHFVAAADRVHVLGQGRLESSGSFDELRESCETFRRVLRQSSAG